MHGTLDSLRQRKDQAIRGVEDVTDRVTSSTISERRRMPMSKFLFGLLVLGLLSAQPNCTCGPDFCLNSPGYTKALQSKKQALAASGYPSELVLLLDRASKCVAAIQQAPDGFSIMRVKPNESITSVWTAQDEALARKQVIAGEWIAYYKMNSRKTFACCQEPKPEQRPDWDSSVGLNLRQAYKCSKSTNTVSCKLPD
jgi:hypothetical protein